jgi:hypothetical protein
MSETHQIAGAPRGEPLAADRVGACVRVPLSGGAPSPRWSRALGARLTNELTGHAAVGHLRLGEVVQGTDLVLEGVEECEAAALGACLERAVAETNASVADGPADPANMPQARADEIAAQVQARTG